MRRSVSIVVAVVGLGAGTALAAPYSYTETFDSNNASWALAASTSTFNTTNNPGPITVTFQPWESTGGNTGGWVPATRSGGNGTYFSSYSTSSGGNFNGDVTSRYDDGGNASQMIIGFDMRRIQLYDNPGAGAVGENYMTQGPGTLLDDLMGGTRVAHSQIILYNSNQTSTWTFTLSSQPTLSDTQWTSYSTTINFNWTDAQAAAAGWVHSTGTTSFASTLTNMSRFTLTADKPGSNTHLLGIDNVKFATVVPEPAEGALAALAGCGLLLLGRRRRKQA